MRLIRENGHAGPVESADDDISMAGADLEMIPCDAQTDIGLNALQRLRENRLAVLQQGEAHRLLAQCARSQRHRAKPRQELIRSAGEVAVLHGPELFQRLAAMCPARSVAIPQGQGGGHALALA